jgi:hypothetical protein
VLSQDLQPSNNQNGLLFTKQIKLLKAIDITKISHDDLYSRERTQALKNQKY